MYRETAAKIGATPAANTRVRLAPRRLVILGRIHDHPTAAAMKTMLLGRLHLAGSPTTCPDATHGIVAEMVMGLL